MPDIPEAGDVVKMPGSGALEVIEGRVAGSGPDGWLVFVNDSDSTLVEVHEEPDQHLPHRIWQGLRTYI
jgi:hypothetical protein